MNLKDRLFNPLIWVKPRKKRIDELKPKAMHGKHIPLAVACRSKLVEKMGLG